MKTKVITRRDKKLYTNIMKWRYDDHFGREQGDAIGERELVFQSFYIDDYA